MPVEKSDLAFVDTKTAAEMLGVSKSHLEKLRLYDPTKSPPIVRIGRSIRYPVHKLVEWADAQTKS